jgi:SAM-dependent methyltransferase
MKRCLGCRTPYPGAAAICPCCGWQPALSDGFPAYAPEFAQEGSGFRSDYFQELVALEADYFWFRARNRLIVWALGKYGPQVRSFLEIGCGTGYVLSGIARAYPDLKLHGSELFTGGLKYAAERAPGIDFMQMDARRLPFVAEFDAIGAFDILEHIEEDQQVLAQVREALKPNGIVLLTVPQHRWLWSPNDVYACHVRRYRADELRRKVEDAGLEILRSTSFVTTLLPVLFASRMIQRRTRDVTEGATTELAISPALNRALEMALQAEIMLIRSGIDLPAGGSRLVIARRKP